MTQSTPLRGKAWPQRIFFGHVSWCFGTLGIHPPSASMSPLPCGVSLPLWGGASPPCDRRLQVERLKLTADLVSFGDTINAFERQSMTPKDFFWSCFLMLWDPGNPPSFCKHVSSSLRSLSSSLRRSFSSLQRPLGWSSHFTVPSIKFYKRLATMDSPVTNSQFWAIGRRQTHSVGIIH